MEDRVADVLSQRAAMETGISAAVAVSLLLHAGVTGLAIWAAARHTTTEMPVVMNIKFAQPAPQPIVQAAPMTPQPVAALPKPIEAAKPIEPPKPGEKPVVASPFGRSTKKETPPARVSAPSATTTTTTTSTQPQIAVGAAGVTAIEGGDFPYTIYIDRMNTLIGTHWFRPQVGSGATTTLYFVINRDGSIRDSKVEVASGNPTFDRAALRALLESSPLPPLPFGYSGTYLGVHLTFR